MIKNQAGQVVTANLVALADGTSITSGAVTVEVLGDGGTKTAGAGTIENEGGGTWSYFPTAAETNFSAVTYSFSHADALRVDVQFNPVAGSTTPTTPTVVIPQSVATKAIVTAHLTGKTLYWYPLSRSLANWTTYRVLAVESGAPDLGKYSATLESSSADLSVDPDATFVLFEGASQPSSFSEGLQATTLVVASASSGTRTVLATAPSGITAYWYPLSRSLDDWGTYRTLATEASAPDTGRYSAVLSAVDADLTADPYATFVLFSGAAQPSSFTDGLRTVILGASTTASSIATPTTTNYSALQRRVGHYLFGIRSNFSEDQQNDINDCLHDGLRRVYAAHDWSFLHPVADVSTTAPYSTGTVTVASGVVTLTGGTFPSWAAEGVFQVNNRYYSVASRGGDTQLTLDTTSVTIATAANYQLARPEIPLDAAFDAVSNDSDLTYYPSPESWYPPVKWRHDSTIRQLEGNNPEFDRPVFYSVRTVRFDPTVGSRKVLALYPAPDKVYTLRVPMILRPLLLDEVNLYAIGGEMLSQVILEACLASAETNFEEREAVHHQRYMELIVLAIRDDQERSSPTSLGPDIGDRHRRFGVVDYEHRLREQRLGDVYLGGIKQ